MGRTKCWAPTVTGRWCRRRVSPGHDRCSLHRTSANECSICLGRHGALRRLSCGHAFHRGCIRRWLRRGSGCPLCRDPLDLADLDDGDYEPEASP